MEQELDKLGTVLAVANQFNRDVLEMLKEQQKRQTRIIWASLSIMGMAVAVCGLAVYMTFHSLDTLSDQVRHNTEVINHEYATEIGERLP